GIDGGDHQVHVEGLVGCLAHALHHRRAEADIGHEMPVHHVDMDEVGAGSVDCLNLFAQPGEIGRKDRGGDEDGACHGAFLANVALAIHRPTCHHNALM